MDENIVTFLKESVLGKQVSITKAIDSGPPFNVKSERHLDRVVNRDNKLHELVCDCLSHLYDI